MEELEELILKWSLKNAVDHEGRALEKAVISKVLGQRPDLKERIEEVKEKVREIVKEVNSMSLEEQRKKLEEIAPELLVEKVIEARKELPPLPNAEKGKVVTRLPPEPSGYMHIGHGMSGIINYLYARMYDGKVWLRFEDTNPRKVKKEFYENFRNGYRWLGINWDFEKYESQNLENYYKYAEKLILRNFAYVCSCKVEKIRELRKSGKECEHRNKEVEENLEDWRRMLEGYYREGEVTLRLKGDMQSKNFCMRDPVIFRVIEHPHPIVSDKYRVWPTYDFAVALEDYFCGITHVLRSAEFGEMRTELQNYIRSLFGMKNPIIIQYMRFNFKGTPIQKRKIRELIEKGVVKGWDDPRLATIDAIKRRGVTAEAIRQFTVQVGITKAYHEFEWEMLYSINRKVLDPIVRRYFFVPNPIELEVEGAPKKRVKLRYHPTEDLGFREVETSGKFFVSRDDLKLFEEGKIIRLKNLYNIKVKTISGKKVISEFVSEELLKEVPKIQWVTEDHLKAKVLIPDLLFINGKLNEDSLREVEGLIERDSMKLKEGDIIQAERFGFMRLDKKEKDKLLFIFAHK